METVTIRLDAFEGPLDLLYHLIEKNEIDLYDIPIASLTDQYMQYLEQAEDRDMDGMSEFLVMAATLLYIKSRMLLPVQKKEEEEGPDPREELVERLLEYKKIKGVTDTFREKEETAALVFYKKADEAVKKLREKEPETLNDLLHGVSMDDLYQAFQQVMARKENRADPVRSGFDRVEKDRFTVEEKMEYIRDLLILRPQTAFREVFRKHAGKMERVITFLALLELIKQKEVTITQEETFGEIWMSKYEKGDET